PIELQQHVNVELRPLLLIILPGGPDRVRAPLLRALGHAHRRVEQIVALRRVERICLEAREPYGERVQIEPERLATETPRLDQHGAAATERICHLTAHWREGFDQTRGGARMQARRIAVKAVHVIAHPAFGVHAETAPDHRGQLLGPLEALDPPPDVRERAPLSAVLVRLGPSIGLGTIGARTIRSWVSWS